MWSSSGHASGGAGGTNSSLEAWSVECGVRAPVGKGALTWQPSSRRGAARLRTCGVGRRRVRSEERISWLTKGAARLSHSRPTAVVVRQTPPHGGVWQGHARHAASCPTPPRACAPDDRRIDGLRCAALSDGLCESRNTVWRHQQLLRSDRISARIRFRWPLKYLQHRPHGGGVPQPVQCVVSACGARIDAIGSATEPARFQHDSLQIWIKFEPGVLSTRSCSSSVPLACSWSRIASAAHSRALHCRHRTAAKQRRNGRAGARPRPVHAHAHARTQT